MISLFSLRNSIKNKERGTIGQLHHNPELGLVEAKLENL